MTRQQALVGAVTAALVATVAACHGDNGVSPATASGSPTVRANHTMEPHGSQNLSTDTTVRTWQIPANKTMDVTIAGHRLYFAAGSVCDPATSGYGAGTWETPCKRAKGPVTITARAWVDADGHPYIEFSPALRFNPDDERPVWLALVDRRAAGDPYSQIGYCADDAASCVDESLTDPELVTYRSPKNGYLYRRIKHFSGYHVLARDGEGSISAQ